MPTRRRSRNRPRKNRKRRPKNFSSNRSSLQSHSPNPLKCNAMSIATLELPDYRTQSPPPAARFEKIRRRPVVLTVRDLKKSFGAPGHEHVVFDHVSLDIHRREFITFIGPSGCGKSTFIRIAAGLDEATEGEMLLNGKPIHGP